MPANVDGASMSRVRAMSSAVSIRSEPSRWRWSSAFGIARTSARNERWSRVMARWYVASGSVREPARAVEREVGYHHPQTPAISYTISAANSGAWMSC